MRNGRGQNPGMNTQKNAGVAPLRQPMKTLSQFALLACLSLPLHAAQPYREITMPTVAEAAASFAQPPREYGAIHWAIWGGPQTKERIIADIDKIARQWRRRLYDQQLARRASPRISRPSIWTW